MNLRPLRPEKEKPFLGIKTIPLSSLESNLKKTLSECVESGQTIVVEMPDHRLLTIQPFDPQADDALVEELLESNPQFQELVANSRASPRKPFALGESSPSGKV